MVTDVCNTFNAFFIPGSVVPEGVVNGYEKQVGKHYGKKFRGTSIQHGNVCGIQNSWRLIWFDHVRSDVAHDSSAF